MRQVLFALLGALVLAIVAGIALRFRIEGPETVALLVVLFVSADLLILGALRESFTLGATEFMWYHLVGSGIVMIGLLFVFFGLQGATTFGLLSADVLLRVLMAVFLLFIGVDFVRGGVHYDISQLN